MLSKEGIQEYRRQCKAGAEIANRLPKFATLRATAREMGLSVAMVRRIECQALYKIQMRLKAALAMEN
jgi:hypothetical protein